MTLGSITKIVRTFGSTWGRIQPQGETRQVFFNTPSLAEGTDFASLEVGQTVEFDERVDQVNGSHAEQLVVVSAAATASSAGS
jgi:cold shock CspA family protein